MNSAAFFDVDKTLWACFGEKAFAWHLFSKSELDKSKLASVVCRYLQYELGFVPDVDLLKRQVIRILFEGRAVTPCIEAYSAYFQSDLNYLIFPAMLAKVRQHQKADNKIVIVSAALDFVVEPIARLLNADDCFSSRLGIVGHKFSGEVTGPIYYGQAKAQAIKAYAAQHSLNLSDCHAYGDHWEDRFMLQCVGHPVAVNPDRKLAKLSKQQHWTTLVFPSPAIT
jgi:HAD superfamily hydrolase (TIGR01490 family)